MELIKLIVAALGMAVLIMYLKHVNSELTGLALIGASIVMVIMMLDYFYDVIGAIKKLLSLIKINGNIFAIIAKVVGIGYLVEFTSNLIEDMGIKSLADKVVICGKFAIVIVSMPIITEIINIIFSLLN